MKEVSTAEKVAIFRKLHERPESFVIVNPWDLGSAKILEGLGFEALATTSGGFAWSIATVDGAVDRETKLAHCRQLAAGTGLPLSADLGIGFGQSANDVFETVRLAAATGLAGGSIEDASALDGVPIPLEQAVERIAAAVDAARASEHGFVLTARCEHFVQGSRDLAATIRRLQAYGEAGADVLFAPGMVDIDEIRSVCEAVDQPVNVLTGFRGMQVSFEDLQKVGVKRISIGTQLARIAYGAFLNAATELKAGGKIVQHDIDARSADIMRFFTK